MMTFDKASSDILGMQRRSAQMGFDNRAMGNGGVPFTNYLDSVHDATVGRNARVLPQAMADGGGGVAPRALAGLRSAVGGGGGSADDGEDWLAPYGGDRYLASTMHELATTKANDEISNIKYPAAHADELRSAAALDALKKAATADDIDNRYGTSMHDRDLARNIQDMAATSDEQNREFGSPMSQYRRQEMLRNSIEAAQPKVDIAQITGDAKVGAAGALGDARTTSAAIAADSRRDAATTNAVGHIGASGYASQPEAAAVIKGLQSAAGGVPGVGSFTPDVEQRIAAAAKLGVGRAEAIAKLKQTGVIK